MGGLRLGVNRLRIHRLGDSGFRGGSLGLGILDKGRTTSRHPQSHSRAHKGQGNLSPEGVDKGRSLSGSCCFSGGSPQLPGSSLPGRHRHAGGGKALLLGQQPGKESQRCHGVELVALLLEFFRFFLQILSAVVQPGLDGVFRAAQAGGNVLNGNALNLEHQDAHPLFLRQSVNHLPHQLLGLLPGVGKLRLGFFPGVLHLRDKVLILLGLHLRKQEGIVLLQGIFGLVCHNHAQPAGECLRFFQGIQLGKGLGIGLLQHILRRLLPVHVLHRQVKFALVGALVQIAVSFLFPLQGKRNRLGIGHVSFLPLCFWMF